MGNTQKVVKASVESAYGKSLREHGLDVDKIEFDYSFDELDAENPDDVAAARAKLEDADIVQAVNAKRKASARAKALEKVLAANKVEAPAADAPETVYRNLLKQFKLAKMEDAQAESMARSISGFEAVAA